MSIIINDNLAVNVGKPVDSKYLNILTPWVSVVAAQGGIPITYRYLGLTVNINGIEYWWKDSVADVDLIEKKYDSVTPVGDFITGVTNMGYFSGRTGIQCLQILGTGGGCDGTYYSQFNNYYIDSVNKISIGEYPHRGFERRAYVNTPRTASWIYNVPTNTWVLTPNDVVNNVGCSTSCIYTSTFPNTSWSGYVLSGASVQAFGSLTTGDTCTYGAPVYGCTECQDSHLRTLISCSPNTISVGYNDNYIYLSGTTGNLYLTGGTNGLTKTGQNIGLGGTISSVTNLSLTGTSSLNITDSRTTKVGIQYAGDYSSNFTPRSLVDAGYVTGLTSSKTLIKNVNNLVVPTYSMNTNDFYIGTSGGSIVSLLPNINGAAINGQIVVIADVCGNADVSCYVQVNGLFFGGASTACINTSFGSISFIYNSGKSCWGSIGFAESLTV